MDWFERLMGFAETTYEDTQSLLELQGQDLVSLVNGRRCGVGAFEFVSLQSLKARAAAKVSVGKLKVRNIQGDVRAMHREDEYSGALFQVASQFNALEMTGPNVTPEHGVGGYQYDHTQGPACAMAAGAGTIYRNYLVPVGDQIGQTHERQLDGLAAVGAHLSRNLGLPVGSLWEMRNGYALCRQSGLAAIGDYLRSASSADVDGLREKVKIAIHWDVQVTDGDQEDQRLVSQAYCAALPVSYCGLGNADWQPFAELVLSAAYEATIWAAVLNLRRGASNIILLTRLGGGVFGNDDAWIDAAIRPALDKVREINLDVRLVNYGSPHPSMLAIEDEFS